MESGDENVPLQLAIVGRPNVGKSTLLNTLLQEKRVLVGPEAGLTRDSIRAQFQFDNRTIFLVSYNPFCELYKRFLFTALILKFRFLIFVCNYCSQFFWP